MIGRYVDQYNFNKNAYKHITQRHPETNIIKQINHTVGGGTKKYYIVHSTNFDNMIQILKTKTLYANKYIDVKNRRLSGSEQSDYVFANMVICNKQIDNFGIGLIFDGEILNKQPFIFNFGWIGSVGHRSIVVNRTNRKHQINRIYHVVDKMQHITDHEILFKKKINLKYLIGINCPDCNDEQIDQIGKMLNLIGRNDIRIYRSAKLPII